MKKKDKNILSNCIKGLFIGGLSINVVMMLIVTIVFLIILFTDKSNIYTNYENMVNSATMSENLTWFFYLTMCLVDFTIAYILYLISIIFGFISYKFENKVLKIVGVVLNIIGCLVLLFVIPVISYYFIPLYLGCSCLIFSLYLEKKKLDKDKTKKIKE